METEVKSCLIFTRSGARNACIYTFKPDVKKYRVDDIWTCPSCGSVWIRCKPIRNRLGTAFVWGRVS